MHTSISWAEASPVEPSTTYEELFSTLCIPKLPGVGAGEVTVSPREGTLTILVTVGCTVGTTDDPKTATVGELTTAATGVTAIGLEAMADTVEEVELTEVTRDGCSTKVLVAADAAAGTPISN